MILGVDYCTSLFGSCHQPCHGELHGKPENFSIEMTRISHSTDVMTMTLLFYEMPVSQCMHSQAGPSMLLASV